MEHESLREPHYLPLRVGQRRTACPAVLRLPPSLGKLGQYVDRLLHQIADEIRQGNIDADPMLPQ